MTTTERFEAQRTTESVLDDVASGAMTPEAAAAEIAAFIAWHGELLGPGTLASYDPDTQARITAKLAVLPFVAKPQVPGYVEQDLRAFYAATDHEED